MKRIKAFELEGVATTFKMARGARVLCARYYDGGLYVYAEESTEACPHINYEERVFLLTGTGHNIALPPHAKYIDTVIYPSSCSEEAVVFAPQTTDKGRAWHVYEITDPRK